MAEKKLTDDQLETFKEAFALFDKNNDGTIEFEDLGKLFRSLGHCVTDAEVNHMINEREQDNDKVELSDFITMITRRVQMTPQANEEQIRDAFKTFDQNDDGFISEAEFKITLRNLGEKLSDEEIKEMIKEVDLNGDGKVDYREFTAMMLAR